MWYMMHLAYYVGDIWYMWDMVHVARGRWYMREGMCKVMEGLMNLRNLFVICAEWWHLVVCDV